MMWLIKHFNPEPIAEEYSPDNLTPHQLSQQLARDLEDVERLFNMTSDPDLIDAYIFERAALMARLRYLLNSQRAAGGKDQSHPIAPSPQTVR